MSLSIYILYVQFAVLSHIPMSMEQHINCHTRFGASAQMFALVMVASLIASSAREGPENCPTVHQRDADPRDLGLVFKTNAPQSTGEHHGFLLKSFPGDMTKAVPLRSDICLKDFLCSIDHLKSPVL